MLTCSLEMPAPLPRLVAAGVDMVTILEFGNDDDEALAQGLITLRRSVSMGKMLLGVSGHNAVADKGDFFHQGTPNGAEMRKAALPFGMLLGVTCHTREELEFAMELPAVDFICVGPHTEPELIAQAALMAPQYDPRSKVWFATGGVNLSNLEEMIAIGVRRIACTRAIAMAPDPILAASKLSVRLSQAWSDDPRMDDIALHPTPSALPIEGGIGQFN
jgi:thiamine-phosphate pyrophosphorylase